VCLAYLAATTGEALLSPVFPVAAEDLGLDLALGGVAFGVLTATIAVANLVGGALLPRLGVARLIRVSMLLTAAGGVAAAAAGSFGPLLGAQVLLGAGSGLSFPAGLQAVGILAGPRRRGFAMGIYGVAFSGGLTLAAVLTALGASSGWRLPFVMASGLAVVAAVATLWLRVPPVAATADQVRLRAILGTPTAVGSVGAVCQYGTISFLTTFAVEEWGFTAAAAAALLAVGRVLSIVAKLLSGASADRVGPRASARRTAAVLVATGTAWCLLPGSWPVYAMAAVFAGTVSSIFPIANLLAVDRFGQRGGALGLYRSVQIGIGALTGLLVGVIGESVGLRPVVLTTMLAPLALFWICREPRAAAAHPRVTRDTGADAAGSDADRRPDRARVGRTTEGL
jgi:MFS family permease